MANLIESAEAFASILTEVVNGTVSTGVRFVVTPFEGPPELAWVYPEGSTPANVSLIPIVAGLTDGEPPRLWLRTSFQVRLDDTGDHLAVQQSVFGLVIDEKTKRPAVRVEYDRDKGNEPDDNNPARHRRSAAHVQIHGSSEELEYVQGPTATASSVAWRSSTSQLAVGASDPRSRTSSSSSGLSVSSLGCIRDGRTY